MSHPIDHDIKHRSDERVASAASPEQLWATCLAEQPGMIADIVTFIESARARLMDSPPPDGTPRPDKTSSGT